MCVNGSPVLLVASALAVVISIKKNTENHTNGKNENYRHSAFIIIFDINSSTLNFYLFL